MIEKCLGCANAEQVTEIVVELFNAPNFFSLLVDRFSNFVIQKALEVTDLRTRAALIGKILEHQAALKTYPHGRHVLSCINKLKVPVNSK